MTTNPFSVTVGPTAQLAVTVQPPASVAAGSGFGLQVSAEDQYGNVVPTYGGSVTVALADNPAGGALGGTTTATLQQRHGHVRRPDLDQGRHRLHARRSPAVGLTSPTSMPLTVTAAAATQLVVTSRPPAAVVAGSTFGLQVSAEDPFGNVNSSVSGSVTVALAANPGGGALGGTTNVSFSNGLATFGLTLDAAAIGYTLQAASSGLAPPPPIPLNVTAAAVTQLVVISQPPATVFAGARLRADRRGRGRLREHGDRLQRQSRDRAGEQPVAGSLGGVAHGARDRRPGDLHRPDARHARQRPDPPGVRHRAAQP